MTSPKEDQQPMTTREEMDGIADVIGSGELAIIYCHPEGLGAIDMPKPQRDLVEHALRLASRQEVSVTVDEIARVIDPIAFDTKPSMYGLRSQQELEKHVFVGGARGVARDKARALLAEYSITKRTTEG